MVQLGLLLIFTVSCVLADISVDVADLQEHLLSDALSKKRSHEQPDNKDVTSAYIVDEWKEYIGDQQSIVAYSTDAQEDIDNALDGGDRIILLDQTFHVQDFNAEGGPGYLGINYILIVKGNNWGGRNDRPIMLGAHYDSVSDSPGTDDNASGIAALLEVSRVVASEPRRRQHTAIFVAFDFEEYGLIGSEKFVQAFLLPLLRRYDINNPDFQGAIILDTIMNYDENENSQAIPEEDTLSFLFPEMVKKVSANSYRGDFLFGVGRLDEEDLMNQFTSSWESLQSSYTYISAQLPLKGNEIPPPFQGAINDFLRSDHASFWLESSVHDGMKAVFLTDSANFRGQMKNCYHSPCDDVNSITPAKLQFLAQTTRSIAATMIGAITEEEPTTTTTTPSPKPTKKVTSDGAATSPGYGTFTLLLLISTYISNII